jgi:hypothetical protein
MTHLALRLTARSEARIITASCFTSNSEVRSKESHLLPLSGKVLSDNTKLISKVFRTLHEIEA